MNWLINLFIRQRVRNVVQNYIDCPSNWKFYTSSWQVTNERHGLRIEFYQNFNGIYELNIGFPLTHKDALSCIEKKYLCSRFKYLLRTAQGKPIPTKATHPEEFI